MRVTTSLAFAALLVCMSRSSSQWSAHAEEIDVLQVMGATGDVSQLLFVASATFGGRLPKDQGHGEPLRLVYAEISGDCKSVVIAAAVVVDATTAVLVDRGAPCSFVEKAMAVQTAGAALMVVADTVAGAFASGQQTARPIYDCSLGRSTVNSSSSSSSSSSGVPYPAVDPGSTSGLGACTQSAACVTNTCVYTDQGKLNVCCFANTLVRMGVDAASLPLAASMTIPALFACYQDSQTLKRLLVEDPLLSIRAFDAEESPWNVSMLLTWLLGVAVVVGGAYCSATDERRLSYLKIAQGYDAPLLSAADSDTGYVSIDDRPLDDQNDDDASSSSANDRVELSMRHALLFVIGSSSMLLMLYYGHLALVMNVLFLVASTAAMVQVVVLPVLTTVLPLPSLSASHRELVVSLTSVALASALSIYWFTHRTSDAIWPLQDLLCICLCFVAIDSIHLPNLRVASALLSAAFLYDIFFVYVSPLIFGSSVMVDVASGGGAGGNNNMQANTATAPTVHEKLPMVLSIPLLFSYYGGNALLGLGDLVLPGLLVSFCIRHDYAMGYPISRNYFMAASASYAMGLLLANVAAIALRDVIPGQPALMYIVPLMLGSVVAMASHKNEVAVLWDGPVGGCFPLEKEIERPRREEVEPFLKKYHTNTD